ncbi:MAG: shikimate kinase [Syntrophus sp. (in: bacteria)]|nr:shikimate kinase [Syntrophus sp. (in: bacteria)]
MNIILTGYRCTGKTSVGRRLAERMGLTFYDTDELVERQTQRTIPQIVAEQGWQAFREAETAVIRDLSGADHSVIALGGGAVLDIRNVESLKKNGFFVWLFAAAETIAARMEKDVAVGAERPSLTGKPSVSETDAIMAEREPLYRSLADLAVDTTLIRTDCVAEEIRTTLRERVLRADGVIKGKEK